MKKILYITSSFYKKGSASIRNCSLVLGLADNNCQIDVLTQKWPEKMEDESLKKIVEKNKNITIFYDQLKIIKKYFYKKEENEKNKVYLDNKYSKLFREILKNLYFYPDIDMEWINSYSKNLNFEEYDLVITSSDTKTAHYIGKKIKNKYQKKWIQIWGDPWFDDKGTYGIKKLCAYFSEKKLLKSSDLVVYVSKPTSEVMKTRFKKLAKKIEFYPRTFLKQINTNDNERVENKNYKFLYPGSIYYGRKINDLLDVIKKYNLNNTKKIEFTFLGEVTKEIKNIFLSYDFVKYKNSVNYEEVCKEIEKSDILIFLSNDSKSNQIPGKLYDYFGTDKTILALFNDINNNEVYEFIKNTKRCICLANEKEEIIIEEIISEIGKFKVLFEYNGSYQANKILKRIREEKQ